MKRIILAILALGIGLPALAQTATATVGIPFTYQLAPAANAGYLVTIDGAQTTGVAGLSYNNTTGIISGTPTAAGVHKISVQQSTATAGIYNTSSLTLTINAGGAAPPPPPPPPPTTLFCATDPNPACGVVLTWAAPATPTDPTLAVTGYLIFRGVLGSGTTTQITAKPITGTTYTDNTIAPSTTYVYDAVSVDAAGTQSPPSNTVSVAVAAAPSVPTPATPENLTGSVVN